MTRTQLPVCNALWIGGRLGALERACLRSFIRCGHRIRLYAYGPIGGLPEGVEVAHGSEVLPASQIVRYAEGSPAVFSNRFRYELMARGAGLWIDTDVYCLTPFDLPDPYLYGWQDEELICTAVLRLPRESKLLERLRALFGSAETPAWLQGEDRLQAQAQVSGGDRIRWQELGWGLTGPHALTNLATELGLADKAQPAEVFYPKGWEQANWVFDPAIPVESVAGSRTRAIHLWNKMIAVRKDAPALPGSFMARLQAEGV